MSFIRRRSEHRHSQMSSTTWDIMKSTLQDGQDLVVLPRCRLAIVGNKRVYDYHHRDSDVQTWGLIAITMRRNLARDQASIRPPRLMHHGLIVKDLVLNLNGYSAILISFPENCRAILRIQRWWRDRFRIWQDKRLAFGMGLHPRLGHLSWVQTLNPDLLRCILGVQFELISLESESE
jgi:hypothetical protein